MNTLKLGAVGAFMLLASAAGAQAAEYTVKMVTDTDKRTYTFEPRKLTIKSGDTVTWVNTSDDIHNVMAESIPKTAEAFTSPDLEKKDQKWSYTFKQSGTYRYHCHPHHQNGMAGAIIVDKPSKADEVKDVAKHDHGGHQH
jgi:plastocyanin